MPATGRHSIIFLIYSVTTSEQLYLLGFSAGKDHYRDKVYILTGLSFYFIYLIETMPCCFLGWPGISDPDQTGLEPEIHRPSPPKC